MNINYRGILIILSGPSGSGKDSVINELLKSNANLKLSVSLTTRPPRVGEIDGKDYIFISKSEFEDMIEKNKLIEYTEYCGNYYGTCKSYVTDLLEDNNDVMLEIDVQGGAQIREIYNDSLSVFIMPPSINVLYSRLIARGLDSESDILKRIEAAKKEIEQAYKYDYIVVNDSLNKCVSDIKTIILSEKMSSKRLKHIISEVLDNGKSIS